MPTPVYTTPEAWMECLDRELSRSDVRDAMLQHDLNPVDIVRVGRVDSASADLHGRTSLTHKDVGEATGLSVRTVQRCRLGIIALGLAAIVDDGPATRLLQIPRAPVFDPAYLSDG